MKKAEKKALKEKLKAMTFKEKREYYKSQRIGWKKAWHLIKWVLGLGAAFIVACLIIMIVQINSTPKHTAQAKLQPVVNTGGGLKVTVLNGAHVSNKEPITATVENTTSKSMNIVTGETTDPIGKGFGLLSDQEMKLKDNQDFIIKPHQTLKLTYGLGEGRKVGGKYMINVSLWKYGQETDPVVEVKFDSK